MGSKWDDRPYAVGKGKPPQDTRFGQPRAPKPGRRRRGSKNTDTLIREALSAQIEITENGSKRKISKRQAAITQLVNRAASGEQKAIEAVLKLDREIEARTGPDQGAGPLSEIDRAALEEFARLRRDGENGGS